MFHNYCFVYSKIWGRSSRKVRQRRTFRDHVPQIQALTGHCIRNISCFLAIFVTWAADSVQLRAAEEAGKPNILFLLTDDQSYETIRELGQTDIDTPHLDRFVQQGTTFTHAYNMGSWSPAVCVASRAMLVTGRQIWDAQRASQRLEKERQAGVLWPQLMHAAGYHTSLTGKWHINVPAQQCFDIVRHVRPGMPKTVPDAYDRPQADRPDPWSPSETSRGGYWEGGQHWSEVTADDAIDFIEDAKKTSPFFLYVAFNAPHDPRQSPQEYVDQYPLDRVEMPQNFLPEYPYRDAMGAPHSLRDEKLAPLPRTELAIKTHRREYYAIISHLDAQIGRILNALEKSGQAKNTWIFLTADHGLSVGHHGLIGKQNMYDDSVRVPLVVVGPDVPPNKRLDTPVYLQDIMPTTLALAGITPPEHIFFHSLLPLINGERTQSYYPSIYGAYLDRQRAMTRAGWKLIAYPRAGVLRLFDLQNDPLEMQDLADAPQHRARKQELFAQLEELQQQLKDPLDLSSLAPRH